MKDSLSEYIERFCEQYLEEAKIDKLIASSPDYSIVLSYFKDVKPKYLEWLLKQFKKHGFTNKKFEELDEYDLEMQDIVSRLKAYLNGIIKFDELAERNMIKQKDIGQYQDIGKVLKAVEDAKKELDKKEKEKIAKSEKDIIYEDEIYFAIEPKSTGASCYYGKGTRWCISATESKNYFDEYTKNGAKFIFIIDKINNDKDAFVYYPNSLKKGILVFEIYDDSDDRENLSYFENKYPRSVFEKILEHIGVDFQIIYASDQIELLQKNDILTTNIYNIEGEDLKVFVIKKNPIQIKAYDAELDTFFGQNQTKDLIDMLEQKDSSEKIISIINNWAGEKINSSTNMVFKPFIENPNNNSRNELKSFIMHDDAELENLDEFKQILQKNLSHIYNNVFKTALSVPEIEDMTDAADYQKKLIDLEKLIPQIIILRDSFSFIKKNKKQANKFINIQSVEAYLNVIENFIENLNNAWEKIYKQIYGNEKYIKKLIQSPYYKRYGLMPSSEIKTILDY